METRNLRLFSIELSIKLEEWDEAFEWIKDEVHECTVQGAIYSTKVATLSKSYEKAIALLKLKKDINDVYMEEYKKVVKLRDLERSKLSLWSKLPGRSFQEEESSSENEENEDQTCHNVNEKEDGENKLRELVTFMGQG